MQIALRWVCCPDASHVLEVVVMYLQVQGYAIFKDGKYAAVKYPTEGYSQDVAGRSFHHGRFVQKLRQRAAAQPSVVCREATVRKLVNGETSTCGTPRMQSNGKAAHAQLLQIIEQFSDRSLCGSSKCSMLVGISHQTPLLLCCPNRPRCRLAGGPASLWCQVQGSRWQCA